MKFNNLQTKYLRRLATFTQWKNPVNCEDIAEAGFECFGSSDLDSVVCRTCNLYLRDWQKDDNPWVEHTKHRNDCWFANEYYGLKYKPSKDDVIDLWLQEHPIKAYVSLGITPIEKVRENLKQRYEKCHKSYMLFEDITEVFKDDIYATSEERLEENLKKIKLTENIIDKYKCKICLSKDVEYCFFPCRHLICCENCVKPLLSDHPNSFCPICRSLVIECKNIFI